VAVHFYGAPATARRALPSNYRYRRDLYCHSAPRSSGKHLWHDRD